MLLLLFLALFLKRVSLLSVKHILSGSCQTRTLLFLQEVSSTVAVVAYEGISSRFWIEPLLFRFSIFHKK